MFIREITKKDRETGKVYVYHRLMEAVRTPKGPRQRIVLNLGQFEVPRDQWKVLADRIEQVLSGQRSLWPVDESIESLARTCGAGQTERAAGARAIAQSAG